MTKHKTQKCRSCGRAVIWAVTAKGKRIPLDAEPNVRGNIIVKETQAIVNGHAETQLAAEQVAPLFDAKQSRYMPHHATCPDAKKWRR